MQTTFAIKNINIKMIKSICIKKTNFIRSCKTCDNLIKIYIGCGSLKNKMPFLPSHITILFNLKSPNTYTTDKFNFVDHKIYQGYILVLDIRHNPKVPQFYTVIASHTIVKYLKKSSSSKQESIERWTK